VSTLISVPAAILIGQAYEGNVMPLILGFAFGGIASLMVLYWTSRKEP